MPQPLYIRREAQVAETRSGLKPFIVDYREQTDRAALRSEQPTTGADFIPPQWQFNVAFISLRHSIFKINRTSASPIAFILGKQLSDADIVGFIESFPSMHNPNMYLGEQDKVAKAKARAYENFVAKIEEARKTHAIRLRAAGMEDVDIKYSGLEAGIAIFKSDRIRIKESVSIASAYLPYLGSQ